MGSKFEKRKLIEKFQISPILKFWIVSGRFTIFGGHFDWFRVVSAGFGWFWLVPGLRKYETKIHFEQIKEDTFKQETKIHLDE